MPKWLKILLILAGLGILALALLIGGIALWVNANKDDLVKQGRVAKEEGQAFGSTHSKAECVNEGLRRLDECGAMGIMCEAQNNLRLTSCMRVASEDRSCSGVPSKSDILKLALWSNQECANRGRQGSQPCGRFMQALSDACAKQ
jgi:hypothetical protein